MSALDGLKDFNGWIVGELNKIFTDQHRAENVMARLRQRHVAHSLNRERKSLNGLGRVRMEVDPYVYHYWGNRLGYQCWRDPQFLREMERDNPEMRVKCSGTKTQVGCTGILVPISRGTRRFVKSYGDG
mgnify:FL=1